MAITLERFWTLRRRRVMPGYLMKQIWQLHQEGQLELADLNKLKASSPLGRILAAGLLNRNHSKEVMKESIEEVGRQVVHDLERYLDLATAWAARYRAWHDRGVQHHRDRWRG